MIALLCSGAMAGETAQSPYLAARLTRLPPSAIDIAGAPAELAGKEHRLFLGVFRRSSDTSFLDVGIDYEYTHFDYTNVESRDRDLHRLQIPVSFATEMSRWRFSGFVAAGVSTSSNVFKDFLDRHSSDDYLVTAHATVSPVSSDHGWFAGLAYDRSFGEPTVYPVAGIEWSASPSLDLRLAFPDPAFRLQLSDNQALRGRIYPAGHQWRVTSDDFTRSFDYRLETWRTEVNWNVRVWRALSIDLGVGYDIARTHRLQGDQGMPIRADAEDSVFVALGFRIGDAPLPYANGASY